MTDFDGIIKQLNPQQRQAVEHVYGPLLVVAGPGTGKTQLLSARVANLLRTTDVAATSILCLTFTDKAAQNMRERLVSMIGADGRNVNIHTFHGLARLIINDYADYFWRGAQFNPISDVAYNRLVEDQLLQLPLSNYFAAQFNDSFTKAGEAARLIAQAKKAGLTPEKLRALAMANVAYLEQAATVIGPQFDQIKRLSMNQLDDLDAAIGTLPEMTQNVRPLPNMATSLRRGWQTALAQARESGKTAAVGAWIRKLLKNPVTKQHDFSPEIKRNQRIVDLCDLYQMVQAEMVERRHYDFDDMIIEALDAIEQNDELRAELNERFQFILIDEFQDTNAAQLRLAHLIAGTDDNLMVVGDDDQAIYKFQGAELNNLINFRDDHKDTATVVLTQNYRSNQNLIDLSTQVINSANERLTKVYDDIDKSIAAAAKHRDGTIEFHSLETIDDELTAVRQDLADYRSQHPDASIAVIGRSHKPLVQLAEQLLADDLPIDYDRQSNVFDHPLVETFVEVLAILDAIERGRSGELGVLLQRSLRRPEWGVEPQDLWHIAINPDYRELDWLSRLRQTESTQHIASWIESMSTVVIAENAVYAVEQLLGIGVDSDQYAGPMAPSRPDHVDYPYLLGLDAIGIIRDMAQEAADTADDPVLKASGILGFCQDYLRTGSQLTHSVRTQAGANPISLLTAHKSKGLEFDAVFIIEVVESSWNQGGGRRSSVPVNLPLQQAADDADDYVRLMFVAITRAVSDLRIYTHTQSASGKDILPATSLLATGLTPTPRTIDDGADLATAQARLAWPRLALATEQQLLADRLDTFTLSATTLTNFLDLEHGGPQYFFERNILRLPDVKSPHAAIGSAMHAVLEHELREINADRTVSPEQRLAAFDAALTREHLARDEHQRLMDEGEKRIDELFNQLGFTLPKGSTAETDVPAILASGNALSGKLDRIDTIDKDNLRVIDYKTSKPLMNLHSRAQKGDGIKAWRYRMQMTFYALLARHNPRMRTQTIESSFVFIFADHPSQLQTDFQPTAEDMDILEQIIDKVYARIQDLNFDQPDITGTDEVTLSNIEQFIDEL